MSKLKIYVKAIIIPLIIGGISGLLSSSSIRYNTLTKPSFAPPGILFPIVWTILYVLMGISYGILESNELLNDKIKTVYYLQLFVNAFWSFFFFILEWRFFAFLWILLLLVLVISMTAKFYRKNKLAGLLQIPYILWVSFAAILNLSIFLLNR